MKKNKPFNYILVLFFSLLCLIITGCSSCTPPCDKDIPKVTTWNNEPNGSLQITSSVILKQPIKNPEDNSIRVKEINFKVENADANTKVTVALNGNLKTDLEPTDGKITARFDGGILIRKDEIFDVTIQSSNSNTCNIAYANWKIPGQPFNPFIGYGTVGGVTLMLGPEPQSFIITYIYRIECSVSRNDYNLSEPIITLGSIDSIAPGMRVTINTTTPALISLGGLQNVTLLDATFKIQLSTDHLYLDDFRGITILGGEGHFSSFSYYGSVVEPSNFTVIPNGTGYINDSTSQIHISFVSKVSTNNGLSIIARTEGYGILESPTLITIHGGRSELLDSVLMYRSFSPESLIAKQNRKLLKPTKRGKGVPNISNILEEIVAKGGFAPNTSQSDSAGGFKIGVSFMKNKGNHRWIPSDSSKLYSWVRLTKWNHRTNSGSSYLDIQNTLEDKSGIHNGAPRGLDSLQKKGISFKALLGQKTKLTPKDHSNHLYAELIALKINIVTSAMEKTPLGFGELRYVSSDNLNGLTISQIAARADSALTFWKRGGWNFVELDSVISKINRAFECPITAGDTISFAVGKNLRLRGCKLLSSASFLQPSTINPTQILSSIEESEYLEEENNNSSLIPNYYQLYQAYPNPFNPSTVIKFDIPIDGIVTLIVYDMLGREIETLFDNEQIEAGRHEIEFVAENLASGMYFYRISAQGADGKLFNDVKKMILLR